ncbi:hypothetical protein HYY71_04875, partial [Candidatus Woesearchaeota archaeon]|nr:hypothetical protein [Candidatus Woesearchaeota archaeon]
MQKKTQNIILVSVLLLILTGSLVFYFNYQIKLAKQDYVAKISDLELQTAKDLQSLQSALGNQISILGSNLSNQISIVDDNLENFKRQNQQEITTLSNLIDQIEQQ